MEEETKNISKSPKNFKIIWHYLKDEKLKLVFYILLTILTILPSVFTAYFWGLALEALTQNNLKLFIIFIIIYTACFILFYTVMMIPKNFLYNHLEIKFMKNVSIDLYKKIDSLPAKAFEDIGVGEFINRLSTDPDRVIDLLSKLIVMICRMIVVFGIFFVCLFTSWILGLEIFIFALLMGFISYKFFPKIKKEQEKIKKESDKYVKMATENITGIREIKSLGIKENIEKGITKVLDKLYKHNMKIKKNETIYYSLNNLLYFLLQFVIILTCGILFIKGKLSYSLFIMIEAYIWRIDDVVESLSDFGVNYNKVVVSLHRIDEIINNRLYESEHFGNTTLDNPKGHVQFKNVTFRYAEDEDTTLNNLNLTIKPHEKIAIVGRSGNGKSTIFNLLLRYFDVSEGQLLIDGIDIRDLSEKNLRDTISIIRQTPFLFNMSIIDNFKLVKDDITLEEIREVCKKAYIDDYVMSLPNKYDTVIGEGGINLSGGQKQRLAIARTLLLNTKIILFDEATSALDNESQEYIKKTIDYLVKDHTVIIVAHRLSTIIDADVINIIDKGTLAGSGTHKELLKTNEVYQKLYNAESDN